MMNKWRDLTQQVTVTHTEIVASHYCVIACHGVINGLSLIILPSDFTVYIPMVTLTWKKSSSPSCSSWPDPSTRWHVHTWSVGWGKATGQTLQMTFLPSMLQLFKNKNGIYKTNVVLRFTKTQARLTRICHGLRRPLSGSAVTRILRVYRCNEENNENVIPMR